MVESVAHEDIHEAEEAVSERPADAHLVRTGELLDRAIRRRWADGLLTRDPDGVFTSYLGAEHIEQLLHPRVSERETPLDDFAFPESTPLGALVRDLALRPSEADLLALLLACEMHPASARLVTYLGGNQAQFSLTVDLVLDIVYRPRASDRTGAAEILHADLARHGRLRRLRYFVLDGADSRASLAQNIRLEPRLLDWLVGRRRLDAGLAAHAALLPPTEPFGECSENDRAAAVAALRAEERLLLADGAVQSGRQMLLQFAANDVGLPLLVVEGRGLPPDLLVAAFREASLHQAILAFRSIDEALEKEGFARFRECLEVFPGTVALIGAGRCRAALSSLRPLSVVEVEVPPFQERARLWRTYLGEESALAESELEQIAALYNLGTGGVVAAASSAREAARFDGASVARGHVNAAVRQLFDSDLSLIAHRATVSQTWDDLVLPEDLQKSVHDILDRIRYRGEVLGGWGFARKLGKGLGLGVLFSGEPGTGKSMVAGLIAKELGLDLYAVDLSRVTSMWLGETEKNLARAFDAAEAGHVLLLFDEADSILAKRSGEIRTANDRHANLETNFILSRLEQFNGIAFFTTNLASAIDPAIGRRMAVQLTFPFPDVAARTELWRRMIPAEAPVDGPIDFLALAERFKITGGFIRNIVLRAAYSAARDRCGISMAHLERAAEREYRERGSLRSGGRLT